MKGSRRMNYCSKCKVNVEGQGKVCPLCQNTLEIINDKIDDEVFPRIKSKNRSKFLFVLRLLLLITLGIIIVSSTVNAIFEKTGLWAVYVVSGVGCAWVVATILLILRKNLLKNIFFQTVVIMILSIVWDFATGMHGWAFNFVVPIVLSIATVGVAILTKVLKIQVENYSVYICNLALLNCLLLISLLINLVSLKLPTLICIGVNFLVFAVFVSFEGNKILSDIKRRLHI